jgi:hypothetical protein
MNPEQAPIPTSEPQPESSAPAAVTSTSNSTTHYTPDFAILICERIATTPQSLARVCAAPDMPSVATLFRWLRDHPDFAPLYSQAKQMQAELLIDQALDIADDSSQDILVTTDGRQVPNMAALARCRMRIEHRKWIASKLLPRKYGHHVSVSAESGSSNSSSSSKTPRQSDSAEGPEPAERVLTEELRMELIEQRRQQMEERAAAKAAEAQKAAAAAAKEEALYKSVLNYPVPPPEPARPFRRMYDCPDPQPVRGKRTINKACS